MRLSFRDLSRPPFALVCLLALTCTFSGRPGPSALRPSVGEPEVFIKGSPLHGANGMAFDDKNQLHVASVLGNEIVVVDPESGELTSTIGVNRGVVAPDDIAFGPDGSIYWTSFATGRVCRLLPDGMRVEQGIAPGVNPIAISGDGRLFVAVDFMGDALYEVDPDLVRPPRLIGRDLGYLNAMDFGPDGLLYGPLWSKGEIVRIDVDTGEIGRVAGGFGIPSAVKFDSRGNLYAVDERGGEVLRVDRATGAKDTIARLTPGLDNLACDRGDRLYVSNGQDGCIVEILADGSGRRVCPGGMVAPGGVAVLPCGGGESVFVADFWTLREFDAATGLEKSVERHTIGKPGGIPMPFTVAADGNNLILSCWLMADVVQVYDPASHRVIQEYRDFDEPLNAIRFQGDIIVAERGTSSVLRVAGSNPRERRVLAGGLGVPVGLAATDDDVWVSDWSTGMVLQIVADGRELKKPRAVARGLSYPEGLAVDLDGSLLVVESEAGRLSRIRPTTGEVAPVADGLGICLQNEHPTWIFNGVAVSPAGVVYVAGDAANAVYRIVPTR